MTEFEKIVASIADIVTAQQPGPKIEGRLEEDGTRAFIISHDGHSYEWNIDRVKKVHIPLSPGSIGRHLLDRLNATRDVYEHSKRVQAQQVLGGGRRQVIAGQRPRLLGSASTAAPASPAKPAEE